ncbi:hypothetical protein GCM10023219_03790 [Stakelama sediminis]
MDLSPPDPDQSAPAPQNDGFASGGVASRSSNAKARGRMRPVPVYSWLPSDLPISSEEIQIVLAVLGPDLTSLFWENG